MPKIIPFSAKEMSYEDLTGAFPYTSSRGYKYLYVLYNYDSNLILVEPLKNWIQMFKNHFLSVLATCDAEFPIVEWDCLLPQAEMTLNMLRPA